MTATADDHRAAAAIATEAGQLLVTLRATLHAAGADPADVKAQGDRSSHDFIVAALAEAHPDDAVLSEEGVDDAARLSASRVWIVDPLDGTREFGEEGRTDWAVHVALWIDGQIEAAAVALPARGLTLERVTGRRRSRHRTAAPAHRRQPHAGRPRSPSCSPNGSAASSWRWGPRAPRRWPSCSATSTCTRTAAASTSGTPPRRSASPPPRACTCRASTARRSSTTGPSPTSPTS